MAEVGVHQTHQAVESRDETLILTPRRLGPKNQKAVPTTATFGRNWNGSCRHHLDSAPVQPRACGAPFTKVFHHRTFLTLIFRS